MTFTRPSLQDSSSDHGGYLGGCGLSSDVQVEYVSCEHDLLKRLVQLVREEDPDFLIGYEVVMSSWGYLIDRAAVLDINLANEISRMPSMLTCDLSVVNNIRGVCGLPLTQPLGVMIGEDN